jgi:uncharacterized protein (DUF169 family)
VNFFDIAQRLSDSLDLVHAPVSIAFTDSIPAGVDCHNDRVPAGCSFWKDGAVRTFATSADDHASCAIGMYTHNLERSAVHQAELADALAIFRDLGYVNEADLPLIPVLQAQPAHVIYGPLSKTQLRPAVVLLFVNAQQALIATEAAQQIEERILPAMGRPACAVIPLVANTGRAAISFGCCGARAYLETLTPDLSIFAIPGSKLDLYAERIQSLARSNATLSKFHQLRRSQIEAGLVPTVKESLAALKRE